MLCYKFNIIVALFILFTAVDCFATPSLSPKCITQMQGLKLDVLKPWHQLGDQNVIAKNPSNGA